MNLGFELEDSDKDITSTDSLEILEERKTDSEMNSQRDQALILCCIAQLSKHYIIRKSEEDRSKKEMIELFKRPYSIHLTPKVFSKFLVHLEYYSKSYFNPEKKIVEQIDFNSFSFLCLLKIIKFNL